MATDTSRFKASDPEAMATLFKGLTPVRVRCVANGHEMAYDLSRGHPTADLLAKLRCARCGEPGLVLVPAP